MRFRAAGLNYSRSTERAYSFAQTLWLIRPRVGSNLVPYAWRDTDVILECRYDIGNIPFDVITSYKSVNADCTHEKA
ncbi:hypothetical protein EVAR_25937_1 [Eumeta japonica]|uniref:Uncharacterized protein n=1 Tax=Eumeta variegata TaxID=151549 RepID=A0A4C1SCM3_EUMVA|nr:hypothetical protein EVAR_25937_1 [Eumeta japonica]